MNSVRRYIEKSGTAGTVIAAMGCPACFPALGVIASSLGLGFLVQFEGLFINMLLPVFASIALLASIVSFVTHKRLHRMLAGIAGPIMVLLTLYPLWQYDWSTYLFYSGLLVMTAVAVWDLASPPAKTCRQPKTTVSS